MLVTSFVPNVTFCFPLAVDNPGGAPLNPYTSMPELNTNEVLWRRHERPTDNIWTPGAGISFRSGITADIRDSTDFPIIADPCPPETVDVCLGGSTNGRACTPTAGGGAAECDAGITCGTQPCPAECTTGCPGDLGDIFNPWDIDPDNPDFTERNLLLNACACAWSDLVTEEGVT